ncbi:MAG: HAD family hydrolase [Pseudomonadota bacterium]|nr:HAD family hydrolase [Pseudomonadota bacterium]
MNKCVFLDRDGIINESIIVNKKPVAPNNLSELRIIKGIKEQLIKLKELKYYLIVITNQPDVVRNLTSMSSVEEINKYIMAQLPIDDIYVCFHDDLDNCNCRKPKPGNIIKASIDYSIDLAASYMIGDRWRDVEAGINAGTRTIFVDYNYDELKPKNYTYCTKSSVEALDIVLREAYENN